MKLSLADDPVRGHRFGRSTPFRLGVEEELFLVDPDDHHVAHRADAVLEQRRGRFTRGVIVGELCDGVVQLQTPVCRTAADAVACLESLRREAGSHPSCRLLGVGLHPSAPFGDVRLRHGDHYDEVAHDTGGVLRQSAFCGMHVHVGMPDADTAVVAFNGMRRWVPLLQALSANSPFWHGADSGLASARTVRLRNLPRTGLPRSFESWEDYATSMTRLTESFGLDGLGSVWWDLRPHPELGTLEIRVADTQTSLDDAEGLIALMHCLVYHEAITRSPGDVPQELLDESSFQAVRRGLDARISHGGRVRHVQDVAAQALDLAGGYARTLGCAESLDKVERMLAEGNGADRQRAANAEGGMAGLLEQLVTETAAPSRAAGPAAVPRASRPPVRGAA
jgi:carboxylate-amine ligase